MVSVCPSVDGTRNATRLRYRPFVRVKSRRKHFIVEGADTEFATIFIGSRMTACLKPLFWTVRLTASMVLIDPSILSKAQNFTSMMLDGIATVSMVRVLFGRVRCLMVRNVNNSLDSYRL